MFGGLGGKILLPSILLKIVGAVFVAAVGLWIVDRVVIYQTTRGYIDDISYVFDLNRHLAQAFTFVIFAILVVGFRYCVSIYYKRRLLGLAIVGVFLVGNSLLLWWGTRNEAFTQGKVATKCFVITRTAITFGEHPGTDPTTGEDCVLVTPEIAEQINAYANGRRPARIASNNPTFFDRATGWPVVWYVVGEKDEVQLFDLMGFDPESGQRLLPISPKVAAVWKQQEDQRRQDRERQSRKAPKAIDGKVGSFFDPVTGKSQVWFWRDPADGHFEFFDAEGFHPQNGQLLAPVTPEVVSDWIKWTKETSAAKANAVKKAPQRIDPAQYAFFDPISGKPRVWYWRNQDGDYEFYDAEGFQQITGQPLTIINSDVVADWTRRQAEKLQKQKQTEDLERQKTEELRLQKLKDDEAKRQLQQQQAAAEQEKRDQEAQRVAKAAHAGELCDADAANPLDQAKPTGVSGVTFEVLRANSVEAVDACRTALATTPSNLRYKYQLARALQAQANTQPDAMKLFGELVGARYLPAYDNLGWLNVSLSKNFPRAAALFRQGIQLGDPESMVSLTALFDSDFAQPQGGEDKWELLSRAAQLGHPGAQAAVKEEQDRRAEEAQKQAQQQQQQQQVMQMMGTFLQALPRR